MAKSCLIITTVRDFSLPLFFDDPTTKTTLAQYGQIVPEDIFDYIYLRDPFNDLELAQADIDYTFAQLEHLKPTAYMVDGVSTKDGLLIEDKWRQYQLFGELMPQSSLLDGQPPEGKIIKKRVSARSRAIYFRPADLPANIEKSDYIVQEKLDIKKEYRVYMIGAQISLPLAIKSSKTQDTRAKIIGLENNLSREMETICNQVYKKLDFDLVGLDIARVGEGYKLIEVNRSPQFRAYERLSGINMAAKLYSHLLNRVEKSDKKL